MSDAGQRRRGRPRTRANDVGVRALERGLLVLEVLSRRSRLSLAQVSSAADLPQSTAYRLLETLRRQGFVSQSRETGLYRLGIRAFEVGSGYLAGNRLHDVARPLMRSLVDDLNETVNLAVLDDREAVYVLQVEGTHMMRAFNRIGGRVPLYCTGVGKVLLAWKDPAEVRELLAEENFQPFTPNTVTGLEEFLRQLQRVRIDGFGLDDEERELGVRCLTAPIRDGTGEVVAALSLSAPSARLPLDQTQAISRQVQAAAGEVSRRLV
jgi:DNA-binding IclR family transcriptional regulator